MKVSRLDDANGQIEYLSLFPKGPISVSSSHPMWEEAILTWRLHPAYNEPEAVSSLGVSHVFTSLIETIIEGSDPDLAIDEDGEYYPVTHLTPAAQEASAKMGAFLAQPPARKTLPLLKRFVKLFA
jgi:hypothetical protein